MIAQRLLLLASILAMAVFLVALAWGFSSLVCGDLVSATVSAVICVMAMVVYVVTDSLWIQRGGRPHA